jgi:hypothetical protein
MPRLSLAAAKNLAVAAVTIALTGIVPLAPTGTGVAWAAPGHTPRPAAVATIGSDEAPTTAVCSKATTAPYSYASGRDNADRHAQAAATSRLSGLPFGGASDYNGTPPTSQHTNAKPTANADPSAQAAATSRLSGLPFGGASDYNGPPP